MENGKVSQNSKKKLSKQGTLTYRQKLFRKNIDKINIKIGKLKDNEFIKFHDYSIKLLTSTFNENKITRQNFINRSEFQLFKNDNLKFFYQKIFCKIKNSNIRSNINPDLYTFICQTFDYNVISMIENLIIKFDECLINRKYDPIDQNTIYNPEQFNDSLNILDINDKLNVTFTKIRKQYEKKKEFSGGNNELKNQINKAYILLRNQYENFLANRSIEQNKLPIQINLDNINNEYMLKMTD